MDVLVSHAHDEGKLAGAWKELLESISAGSIRVWYSSDSGQGGGMPAGKEWRQHLYQRLEQSQFVIAIQTPASAGRPWVMWECGVASGVMRERGLIPVVYGMGKGDLASPLSAYEVYQGENPDQVRRVCDQLASAAGSTVRPEVYGVFVPVYMKTIQLASTPKVPTAEEFAVWRNRFENLVRSGRAAETLGQRQLMYAAFGGKPKKLELAIHDLLSGLLLQQGNEDQSLQEVEFALEFAPNDATLLHRKGLALARRNDLNRAKQIVFQIYSIDPELRNNPEIAGLEGRIYRTLWKTSGATEDLDKAIDAYRRAYDQDRMQYYPGVNAAELLLYRKSFEEANLIFHQVLETCNELRRRPLVSFWTDFTAAQAQLGLGDVKAAVDTYLAGLNREPRPSKGDIKSAADGARRTAEARGLGQSDIVAVLAVLQ
jgi:tetratricopeptide (TPR) repeat protein